jgi:hypothetical protein
MKQTKNVEEPQDHSDNDDSIQDGFDTVRHRDEPIDQPQEDAHYDQSQ